MKTLEQVATLDPETLPQFNGRMRPRLPHGWPVDGMVMQRSPKGWPPDAAAQRVALYEFRFRHRRRPVGGVLLVVPKQSVAETVPSRFFVAAEPGYIATENGRYTTAIWSEGEFVYICSVRGGTDVLEGLQERFEATPA